ncbi:MAG TPA: PepSY-associated TM helix domain-containing protein [Nitrosomonas europaea]|uniref:PepSY-associated TM helix domain-containing protein n=1 Tax=Nitrosomonas europaea TaxID=915 RepID=UPI00249032F6|nr:PepSY-associated TM helix domain-containing protein [Nitrosomonas europaea]HRO57269.1 PepSY-associated TM helix domain-containing protein [Nitrosomonas europaea]
MSSESAHQHAAGVDEERGTLPRRSWRQLWLSIHLYLGLFIGALLVILGLTGSIAVFWAEIDEWLNPELLTVTVPEQKNLAPGAPAYQSLDEIIRVARQAAAPDSRITTVYGARNSEAVYAVYASQPSGAWQRIFVDPYSARVTGVRSYGANEWIPNYFMDAIFQLHFSLLLGMNGQTLMAVCALLLLVSLITGLIVWWPTSGQWRKALTIKRGAGPVRFNFDLHKTLSLYLFPVLGAVLLSGVFMNLNEPFVWVTQLFSPATRQPQHTLTSIPITGIPSIGAEHAWAIATKHYPDGKFCGMFIPGNTEGVYIVTQKHVPKLSAFWSERQIAIDQYSGKILDVRAPDVRRSAGETFLEWQWPLHSGQAFGWPGRILIFLCGLACPVIYATGVIRWLQKRRVKVRSPRHPIR